MFTYIKQHGNIIACVEGLAQQVDSFTILVAGIMIEYKDPVSVEVVSDNLKSNAKEK